MASSGVLSQCVFVKVLQGVKELIFSCDVDINGATTFDSLLLLVLGIQGITIESLEKRDVAVTMVGDPRTGFGARPVRDLGVTVASRLAAGHFITFNVAPPPQKNLAPSLTEAEAERAASAARSTSYLLSAGRGLTSLPEKHDASNNLRSEQLWFNALVEYLQGTGLYFPKSEVCKQDGSGYRFVLSFSRLLNHLDGHHHKFKETNNALPVWEIFTMSFRKTGSHSLPLLKLDNIKDHVNDVSLAPASSGSPPILGLFSMFMFIA